MLSSMAELEVVVATRVCPPLKEGRCISLSSSIYIYIYIYIYRERERERERERDTYNALYVCMLYL